MKTSTRKRKEIPLYMCDTLNAYQKAGHVVSVFPFVGMMSLDGFPRVSYEDAYKKMREVLYPLSSCKNNSDPYCSACKRARAEVA